MVLGNRGSVYFLVHQGELIRVAACRLVNTEESEGQVGNPENKKNDTQDEETSSVKN